MFQPNIDGECPDNFEELEETCREIHALDFSDDAEDLRGNADDFDAWHRPIKKKTHNKSDFPI